MAGDVHGNEEWAWRALAAAKQAGLDMLIHVGDLQVLWPGDEAFTDVLELFLEQYGVNMIFVDGNHDVHPRLRALPRGPGGFGIIGDRLLYAPRGHRWTMGGRRFGALGGAYSIDRGRGKINLDWWLEEEVEQADVARLGSEPLDVLVTHEVPAGVSVATAFNLPDWLELETYRSRLLVREAVHATKPSLVFSGHWHQRLTALLPNTDTRVHVLNKEFTRGNAVVLDTETLSVEEFEIPGRSRRAPAA